MSRTIPAHPGETTLPQTIDHRAKLYSLAAAAAGVSLLVLAQPAEATVVITVKNIPVPVLSHVSIDLNHDGVSDFSFYLNTEFVGRSTSANLRVTPLGGGAVVGKSPSNYASALLRGANIGPSAHFLNGARIEYSKRYGSGSHYLKGKWGGDQPNRFLGVKFLISGTTHYGWVRLTVGTKPNGPGPFSATITEYGYETIANKRLGAGLAGAESTDAQATADRPGPPSLGMLALGADGLALWRREETLPS
jgi:hypothetical protein